jgi:hypothetical protein
MKIKNTFQMTVPTDNWDKQENKTITITAPKSIMLSEIVERLNCYVKHIKNTIHLYDIEEDWFDEYDTSVSYFLIIENNKIINVLLSQCDEYKWLYTLWIAGTEIVDDLGESNDRI